MRVVDAGQKLNQWCCALVKSDGTKEQTTVGKICEMIGRGKFCVSCHVLHRETQLLSFTKGTS